MKKLLSFLFLILGFAAFSQTVIITPTVGASTSSLQAVETNTVTRIWSTLNNGPAVTNTLTSTGTVTYANTGASTLGYQISGTWSGLIIPEVSNDGTTYYSTTAVSYTSGAINGGFSSNDAGQISIGATAYFRFRGIPVSSGTATITLIPGFGTSNVHLDNSLPTGNNVIGKVTINGTPTVAPSVTALTSSPSSVTTSGTVTAGAKILIFETSSDFAGSIDGLRFLPNGFLSVGAGPNGTLPAIPYVVTTGTLYIRKFN